MITYVYNDFLEVKIIGLKYYKKPFTQFWGELILKKTVLFTVLLFCLSAVLGVSVSFAMITLHESTAYFDSLEKVQTEFEEFDASGINEYVFISGCLYNETAEQAHLQVNAADEALKDNDKYIGMLCKQSDNFNFTLVPKKTGEKTEKQYRADDMGLINGMDECFNTSSPLVLEDTYKNMSLYNEFDKELMCKTYTTDQEIPVYISGEVKEKYGLDKYADGVISIYNNATEKYDTITLNCRIAGVVYAPSFSMNTSSVFTDWEVAIPFITNSDGSYLENVENLRRVFVFKNFNTPEEYQRYESDVSEVAFLTDSISDTYLSRIELNRKYSELDDDFTRYSAEKISSWVIIFLAFVLCVISFYLFYARIFKNISEAGRNMKILSAVCPILSIGVFFAVTAFNTRIEFSNGILSGAIPSMVLPNYLFAFYGCLAFAITAVIITAGAVIVNILITKRRRTANETQDEV